MSHAFADTHADPACMTMLALLERIGRDCALQPGELGSVGREASDAAPLLWKAYEEHWRRFCATRLDPQFWGFDHPAHWIGSLTVCDGAPVVIVGTGPSLRRVLPDLKRARAGLHLFTSPRGAEALAAVGVVPDLVLVEHQTPLDAMFSLGDLAHRRMPAMARAPLVAASPNTPAALLAGVSSDRLFVPDPFPTWGLWPATAVAIALASGTRAVTLAGIDLGTCEQPDPAHAPLMTLLALLAAHTDVRCADASAGGATKRGWRPASADAFDGASAAHPLVQLRRPWLARDARFDLAAACGQRVAPLVAEAEATLAAACLVRDGNRSPGACDNLRDSLARLLAAGEKVETRVDVQDGLGASFLPRFWRTSPDPALGHQLWRAAALAAHELVRQHGSLARRLAQGAR